MIKILFLALVLSLSPSLGRACTALMITDKQGNGYSGKTMEYATPLPFEMIYLPKGTKVTSLAPDGRPGLAFETQYPVLGVGADTGVGTGTDTMVEAINDQGLSLSSNQLDGSQTPSFPDGGKAQHLAATDLGLYMLGKCKNVGEVRKALESGEFRVWLPKLAIMGNVPVPLHYIFFDKSGAGIVVEYLDGKQTIHDNPVGVVANAPDFGWHLKNLNNYSFLSNQDKNSGTFGKLKVEAPDSGNALSGVPSSQISAGRFVKAAFYVQYARKANTPEEAVITLAHILNNFDRVYDLAVDKGFAGEGGGSKATSSEVTLFTWMNDKVRNRYYLRTINALNFATFEIDKLKAIQSVVKVPLAKINDAELDGTKILLNSPK